MIMGVMIESNLVEGRQDIPPSGPAGLIYGQSVTGLFLLLRMPAYRQPLMRPLQMRASHGNKLYPS